MRFRDLVVDDGLFGLRLRDEPQREVLRPMVDPGDTPSKGGVWVESN